MLRVLQDLFRTLELVKTGQWERRLSDKRLHNIVLDTADLDDADLFVSASGKL